MHGSKPFTQTYAQHHQNLRHAHKALGRVLDDPGGHCGEPAPDPIPNSAVKIPSAYDTVS